jgi:hypothetical protein
MLLTCFDHVNCALVFVAIKFNFTRSRYQVTFPESMSIYDSRGREKYEVADGLIIPEDWAAFGWVQWVLFAREGVMQEFASIRRVEGNNVG